jgi:hypothetical protein
MVKIPDKPIIIIIGGTVVPKERPQVEEGQARYSEGYAQWQKSAKLALQATIAALPATMTRYFPLSGVRVDFEFHGSVRGNADLDNSEGSWLDAMVKCGILAGDNVRKINQIGSKFFENERPVSAIIIYPSWKPISVIEPSLLRAPSVPTTVKLAKKATAKRSRKPPVKTAAAKKPRLTIVKPPK